MSKLEDSVVDGSRNLAEDIDDRSAAAGGAAMTSGGTYRFARNKDLTVAVVDSDLAECEALSLLFRLEGYHTRFFKSLAELEEMLDGVRPNVVVAAIELAGEDPGTIVRKLRNAVRGVHIFFTSRDGRVEPVAEAMRAGASGAVSRPIDHEKLLRLVARDLRRNAQVVPAAGAGAEVEIFGFDQLTEREREVLELLIEGRSNKETGKHLGISFRTVEVHRASVMRKLNARNTADLIRIVLSNT